MKPLPIKYHINPDTGEPDQSMGIDIDWDAIRKAFKKLHIPDRYYKPRMDGIEHLGYIIDMSDRSRGKTTNKLLLGLILYQAYGIQLHYLRQNSDQVQPKSIRNLYETVLGNGYISRITEGKYNSIRYRGQRWYLQLLDDNGTVLEIDPVPCCVCFGLDESDDQKSIYNAPRGDMIFFDEFITSKYGYYDFKWFTDLCKTIIRDRKSAIIYMSANTIDINTPWFDELCIRDTVAALDRGQHAETVTSLGTHIYIEILPESTSEQRKQVNRKYWGFDTSQVSAITGKGVWTTDDYPHIPPADDDHPVQVIMNRIFVERQGRLFKLQLVRSDQHGLCIYVMPATRTYNDSVIFTADELQDTRYVFAFGRGTGVAWVWEMYTQGMFRYAHNAAGAFIKSYVSYCQSKITAMRR